MRPLNVLATVILVWPATSTENSGIPPRATRTNYPITCFTERVAVGAALLPPEKVRAAFGPEFERRFLVVEVGVYPKLGQIDLRRSDFALRLVSAQTLAKPVEPTALEQTLSRKSLPEIGTARPVGGYLFFPLPESPVHTAYELDYTGAGAWLTLPLTPKRR